MPSKDQWIERLPSLLGPYLNFLQKTFPCPLPLPKFGDKLQHHCQQSCKAISSTDVLCFFFESIQNHTIEYCDCRTPEQVLVEHGLFPASPTFSRIAFSISLLEFYVVLLDEASGINLNLPEACLAAVLESYFRNKGYSLLNRKGNQVSDVFSKIWLTMGWYQSLKRSLDAEVHQTLNTCGTLASISGKGKNKQLAARVWSLDAPETDYPDDRPPKMPKLMELRFGKDAASELGQRFASEILAVELALRLQEFHYLAIPLTQWKEQLLSLGNSFIKEPVILSTHLQQSVELANKISQGRQPIVLAWTINITLSWMASLPVDASVDSESDIEVSDVHKAEIHVSSPSNPSSLQWSNPNQSIQRDMGLLSGLSDLLRDLELKPPGTEVVGSGTSHRLTPHDMKLLLGPNTWLNDSCINELPPILQSTFTNTSQASGSCAILHSFNLVQIRNNAASSTIWRNVYKSQYWTKTTWIVPIHRPSQSHWVLVIVVIPEQKILAFDSLGGGWKSWRSDLADVMKLVRRFFEIAKANNKLTPEVVVHDGPWKVHPIYTTKLQDNDFDCGIWVLAVVATVLRGYHMPDISQSDIGDFRKMLHRLAQITCQRC